MMTFIVIGLVAFLASGLTLYSGFGLGTLLLPAFALFFPAPVAVAATAIVHLLSNLFKASLLARKADWHIVARFGVPAVPAAIAGAWLLGYLGDTPRIFTWSALGRAYGPTAAGLTIGALMIVFAALEFQPWFQKLAAPRRLMPLGGLVMGFLGGLTGQQGALRSIFLLKSGLEPGTFIATGVLIAVLVDLSRIPAYAAAIGTAGIAGQDWRLLAFATLCALAGAYLATRYLTKATIGFVRIVVAGLMMLIGAALMAGVIGG